MVNTYNLYCLRLNMNRLELCFINGDIQDPSRNKLIVDYNDLENKLKDDSIQLLGINGLDNNFKDWVSETDYPLVNMTGANMELIGNTLTFLGAESIMDKSIIKCCDYTGIIKLYDASRLLDLKDKPGFNNVEIKVIPKNSSISLSSDDMRVKLNGISYAIISYKKYARLSKEKIVSKKLVNGFEYHELTKKFIIYDDIEIVSPFFEKSRVKHSGKIEIHLSDTLLNKNCVKIGKMLCTTDGLEDLEIEFNIPSNCQLFIDKLIISDSTKFNLNDTNLIINELQLKLSHSTIIGGLNPIKLNSLGVTSENLQFLTFIDCFNNHDLDIDGHLKVYKLSIQNSFNNNSINCSINVEALEIIRSFISSKYKAIIRCTRLHMYESFGNSDLSNTFVGKAGSHYYNYGPRIIYREGFSIPSGSFNMATIDKLYLKSLVKADSSFGCASINKIYNISDAQDITNSFNNCNVNTENINLDNAIMKNCFKGVSRVKFISLKGYCELTNCFNDCLDLEDLVNEDDKYKILNNSFINNKIKKVTLSSEIRINGEFVGNEITLDTCGILGCQIGDIKAKKIHLENVQVIKAEGAKFMYNMEVNFPSTIEKISVYAFRYCALHIVDLWKLHKINTIPVGAFDSSRIRVIVLPENTVKIQDRAFDDCDRLEHIVIGNKVKEIDKNSWGRLLKSPLEFNAGCYPSIYVWKNSEADKFFKSKKVPVIYIENIEDAYDIIYNRNNRSLRKAKLLLSSNEKFKEYLDDPNFVNSLDIIYNLDRIITGDTESYCEYMNIPKKLSIDMNKYKELGLDRLDTFYNHKYNKGRFNLICALLFCSTELFILNDNNIKTIFNKFIPCNKDILYCDNETKTYIVVQYFEMDNYTNTLFGLLLVVREGKIIFTTLVDRIQNGVYNNNRERYGFSNVFREGYPLGNKEFSYNSIIPLLQVGDTLRTFGTSKISGKLIPDKYTELALEHFLRETVLAFCEKDTKRTINAYFISTINYSCVSATIQIVNNAARGMKDTQSIKHITITGITKDIPDKVVKIIKNINNCDKLKAIKLVTSNNPAIMQRGIDSRLSVEYIVGRQLVDNGIENVYDIGSIELLNAVLSTGFFKKLGCLPRSIDGLPNWMNRNNGRYYINNIIVESYSTDIEYIKNPMFKTTLRCNYIALINGKEVEYYSTLMPFADIIEGLIELADGSVINGINDNSIDESNYCCKCILAVCGDYIDIAFDKRDKKPCLLWGTHGRAGMNSSYGSVKFKDLGEILEYLNKLKESDLDNFYLTDILSGLNDTLAKGYSDEYYYSDYIQDLWDLAVKHPSN